MNNLKIILLKAIIFAVPMLSFVKDKCNSDQLYEQALSKIKKYTFVKDYRIHQKKKKKITPEDYEYFTMPLNRGVKYKFLALSSSEYEGKLVINLYNNIKKEFVFASTLVQGGSNSNLKESIEFKCQSTANYCVGFYFLNGAEGCGVAVSALQQE